MSLRCLSPLIHSSFASQPHNALTNIERNVTDAAQIIVPHPLHLEMSTRAFPDEHCSMQK